MNVHRLTVRLLMVALLSAASLLLHSNAFALTSGATYTVTLEKLNSDGTVTTGATSLGLSTTGAADGSGKLSFSLSGIPNNSSCNFLLFSIKDSGGSVVRRSIAPCPATGGTLATGVSGLTASQTDALLASAASAGTDDPILVVFGLAIVRSTGITSSELTFMANFADQGINGANGFISYLTTNGVTTSQLALYRQSIVTRLANPSSGYSKLIKDSVEATSALTELEARGEAASQLLSVLVQAATTAGFSQDRVLEAFNAMGAIVVPLMDTALGNGDLSNATYQSINSSIGGGLQKLKADRDIEKYSQALTTLGASGSDLTNYQAASTTLLDTMISTFQVFEQVFDGTETDAAVQSAQSVFDTAMNNAFNQFVTDTAASNSRITNMITNIDVALSMSTGLAISDFQFYKSDGSQVNWPLTMVIIVDWVSNVVSNGGELLYTRDTTAIPSSVTWLGSCSTNGFFEKNFCEGNGGVWTPGRTNFGPGGDDMPTSYASIFGIQQDIEILEFARWAAQSAAGQDMNAHAVLEKSFSDSVAALAGNAGGTTDGSTTIDAGDLSALVTLMKSPQF
ncbi:MAG: hypothetical protein ACE5D4_02180 [Thermodesulfobacteriota bacterium]